MTHQAEFVSHQSGFHDRHGIPIYLGDLIRVESYRHRRGRRKMWIYFRVSVRGETWVVENWHDKSDNHQCLLADCGLPTAEVVAEAWLHHDKQGGLMTFNERPRKKPCPH